MRTFLFALCLWAIAPLSAAPSPGVANALPDVIPPKVDREFRGVWVASVGNIDWPSKPGLSSEQQKQELIALLDRVSSLKMNAVILQVRPGCDALYKSSIEPWSEYLTGRMGQAPQPFYDPLEFAVMEAHRRGLELHAWFNPFRARHTSARSPVSPSHVTRRRPQLVRSYGKQLWLDPGDRAVQDYSSSVILDVLQRYDIDGVHIDDYFYPYQELNAAKQPLPFPDDLSWKKYRNGAGNLGRDDWRRENVNLFIRRLYQSIKAAKPWVKFGVSPFGIWRDGYPAGIRGYDAYDQLYADSRKWLASGWVDYFAPQLYWAIGAPEQSYPVLLKWWAEQNPERRHLWPGSAISRAGKWTGQEIADQINATRKQPGATGNILWSVRNLMTNSGGVSDLLQKAVYTSAALIPASPWLSTNIPVKPSLRLSRSQEDLILSWQSSQPVSRWVVQTRVGGRWLTEIYPSAQTLLLVRKQGLFPDLVALSAVDRFGWQSSPVLTTLAP